MTKITGFSKENKRAIEYPELPSATGPVSQNESLPAPVEPMDYGIDSEDFEVVGKHSLAFQERFQYLPKKSKDLI